MGHERLHHKLVCTANGILMRLDIETIQGLMLSEPKFGSVFLDVNIIQLLNKVLSLVRCNKVVVDKVGSTHRNFKF